MSSLISLTNLIGPFSVATKWEVPTVSGFLVYPAATADSPGWGFPIYPLDANGMEDVTKGRIFPGTYGAEGQYTAIVKPGSSWVERKTKEIQSVGPVNWWGPVRPTSVDTSTPRRFVLSYWGPKSRHFADGHVYGTSSNHNYIYMDGGVLSIAPGPVLGAALRAMTTEDKYKFPTSSYWLIAACVEGTSEVVYRRPMDSVAYQCNLIPEVEARLRQIEDLDNPSGWHKIGAVTLSDFLPPTTPWFFNESGTQMSAIRLSLKTFDASPGVSVTETIGSHIRVSIGADTVSTSNFTNDPPFSYKEIGKKQNFGIWTTPPDIYGYTHTFEEHQLDCKATMSGTQIVAVDYVHDVEIVVRLSMVLERGFVKDFMYGTDPVGVPALLNNHGIVDNPDSIGVLDPPDLRDHRASLWYYDSVVEKLTFAVGGVSYSYTTESTRQDADSPVTKNLVSSIFERQHIRYLDVRMPVILSKYEAEEVRWGAGPPGDPVLSGVTSGDGLGRRVAFYTAGQTGLLIKRTKELICVDMEVVEGRTAILQEVIDSSGDDQWSAFGNEPPAPLRTGSLTDWDTMKTWESDFTWTWTYKSYVGNRPTLNDDDSKGKISSRSAIPVELPMSRGGWEGITGLRHSDFTQDFGVAVTPEKALLANMYVPNVRKLDGSFALYTVASEGIDAVTLTGGNRLYPLGVI